MVRVLPCDKVEGDSQEWWACNVEWVRVGGILSSTRRGSRDLRPGVEG